MSAYRTGHTHWRPGRPGHDQLELAPIEAEPGQLNVPDGPQAAAMVRVDRLLASLDRHDARLDSIEAGLVALRGPT